MASKARNTTSGARRPPEAERVRTLGALLAAKWPDAHCELDFENAYQLLCGTILAAQSTDKLVNTVTPKLFARWPDARALAGADPGLLEVMIHSTGFFRAKSRSLLGMARAVAERHDGVVPRELDALVALPGVGRKTANVVRGAVWGLADGVVVDTHVTRLSQRLGLTRHVEPVKIEQDLMAAVPRDQWIAFADRLIWHGRRVCFARKPDCEHCDLAPVCPSAFAFEKVVKRKPTAKKAAAKPKATPKTRPKATPKPKPKAEAKPKRKARRA